MNTYPANDPHGRISVAGRTAIISAAKARRLKKDRSLAPKAKNGLTCPFTYYHVLDALLWLRPGNLTRTSEIQQYLEDRPILWDAMTIGRVINDISESLQMANGSTPIQSVRYWDGTRYWTTDDPEGFVAMENLLEDLRHLIETNPEKDGASPLFRCPSVHTPLVKV